MEKTIDFKVNEGSLQEFANKYFVPSVEDDRRGPVTASECINPYYLIGKQSIIVRNQLIKDCRNDAMVTFTLSDQSKRFGTTLKNTYQYSIEQYDDVSLKLVLVDFKVEVSK